MRAIKKLSCVGHRNLVEVLGIDSFPDTSYIFIDMELCGLNLETFIDSEWTLIQASTRIRHVAFLEMLSIVRDIVSGLVFIHEHKQVHRDLKPENGFSREVCANVLVLYSLSSKAWKIADFGLASVSTSNAKRIHTTTSARGKCCYRAPELLSEKPSYDKESDIWAVGTILYEIATGKAAFDSEAAVFEYCRSTRRLDLWLNEGPGFDLYPQNWVYDSVSDMLKCTPYSRPSASDLLAQFSQYCKWTELVENSAIEAGSQAAKEYFARHLDTRVTGLGREMSLPSKKGIPTIIEGVVTSVLGLEFNSPKLLRQQYVLATQYHDSGRYQEAATLYKDIVASMITRFGHEMEMPIGEAT